MQVETIYWDDGRVVMIDQRALPTEERYLRCRTYREVAAAIRDMVVRGAPAIGVAAAMGVALGAQGSRAESEEGFFAEIDEICAVLAATRPTAVNLFWALERMKRVAGGHRGRPRDEITQALVAEAKLVYREDVEINRAMGRHGAPLIKEGYGVLTHCNAGGLATAGYGTATAPMRAAHEEGRRFTVLVDETRPFLQGARLTAWELMRDGLDVVLITDNMAGHFMSRGRVDLVLVGADRVAANGDAANKIGTYSVAVLARHHGIPFYVVAPRSTVDLECPTGAEIPIEERAAEEVTHIRGVQVAPEGVRVWNPAFDVTPAAFITGIITEQGIASPPYDEALASLFP